MIPQKDLSVLQFLNFVGQMTRDNGLVLYSVLIDYIYALLAGYQWQGGCQGDRGAAGGQEESASAGREDSQVWGTHPEEEERRKQ